MKLSRKWLGEFVDLAVSDKEFDEAMTMSGSKVEGTVDLSAEFSNVVVGRVLELVRHANSDHLWVCQIEVGQAAPVQIVTGAQNVSVGDLVPVALDNSTLPGGVSITAGELRGVLSRGMLCSLAELGLSQRDFPYAAEDGIFILQEPCAPGDDITTVIGADDHVVEFEITSNRPDCLSMIGLAREVAATFGKPLRLHTPAVKGGGQGNLAELLDVDTPAGELCPRYSARMVRNVKIAPSPSWMRERLRAMGVRPINNIVDITNYVMLEYGQPMHAFDYRYVTGGKIVVRRAAQGETLTTLDGAVRQLTPAMLVIADDTRAVGLAGIMGGENSEIVPDTVDVVFESATFDAATVRKAALSLGLRTDASARFEKGLDPMNTLPALNRACELVELLGAGEVLDGVVDVLNFIPQPTTLTLPAEKVNALLGTDIPASDMAQILQKIGFEVQGDTVSVPSWRGDVTHYSDLAEEVARFYGYDNIPCTQVRGAITRGGYSPAQLLERKLGELCRAMGYSEIITYSFLSAACYDKIRWAQDDPRRNCLKLCNPLGEDTATMRSTLLPSMLEILSRNFNYRNQTALLYELGRIYRPRADGLADEPKVLCLGAYGGGMDFFRLKGAVETTLASLRVDSITVEAVTDHPSYHPGRCARVLAGGVVLGVFGQIHPLVARNYDLETEVFCAELSFPALLSARGADPVYKPLPKFPGAARDLALVCDDGVAVGTLDAAIRAGAGDLLREVTLFDVYRGPGVADGKKSAAFRLLFRAEDRSLTSEEVEVEVSGILAYLEKEMGVLLR